MAPPAAEAPATGPCAEEPDPLRTCFERDRDRILHSTAFRRLAGKTQVFVYPADHQRTRLTHALEVAQVATAVSRAVGLNVALTEAIALGHDCGHGPGGHASEDAFDRFVPGGYHHAVWGAEVVLTPLNLCRETLDGIRNHSWSLPTPATPEGAVVSWADRCAYSAHDLEDAVSAGVVRLDQLPAEVTAVLGATRRQQLSTLIAALVDGIQQTGVVGMDTTHAEALAALRGLQLRPHLQPAGVGGPGRVGGGRAQRAGRALRRAPRAAARGSGRRLRRTRCTPSVAYVAGMTDRFAFDTAVDLLGWPAERLPRGFDSPHR